jgi:hypothetical protein
VFVGGPGLLIGVVAVLVSALVDSDAYRLAVAIAGLGFLVLAVTTLVQVNRTATRVRPDTSTVESVRIATHVHSGRVPLTTRLTTTATGGVMSAMLAFGLWTGIGDLPATPGQRLTLTPSFALLALIAPVDLASVLIAERRVPFMLTAEGITIHGGLRVRHLGWGSLVAVEPGGRLSYEIRGSLILRRKHVSDVRIDVSRVGIGLPAMYWLLDFYIRHPELRDELGDGRCAQRIEDGSIIGRSGWIAHG